MSPRRLLPWLFALALLLGQAAAFAHAIGHLHKHDSGAPEPVCEMCVTHANLGSGLPTAAAVVPVVPLLCHVPPVTPASSVAAAPASALARAPPAA